MSLTSQEPTKTAAAASEAPELVDAPGSIAPKRESLVRIIAPPIVFGSAIIGLWYLVSYVVLSKSRRFLLVPPHEVWTQGFGDSDARSEMISGLWSSTKVAVVGLLIAIVLGVIIAVLMSQSKLVERAVFPFTVIMQAMPILAIVPLIGFWFGYGWKSRVFVAVLIALFPIVVNTLFGLLSAEQGLHDLLTLHNANRFTRLVRVQFPSALPAMFAGLRISAGLSVIGAIVGDFFFGQGDVGIGQLLKRYASKLQGAELLAAVFLSCSLGVAAFLTFGWISNRAVGKWATNTRGK